MKDVLGASRNRRDFLYVTAGAAMLGLDWRNAVRGEEPQDGSVGSLRSRAKTTHALGTQVSITAIQVDAHVADRAIDHAFGELHLVESLMSIYRADSQVSRLNRDRILEKPHPYLVEVLRAAQSMSRQSNGAFDVTVQPLWSLFAAAKKQGRLPDDDQIEAARGNVDWRQVEVSSNRIRLHGEATLTLNGIAQGFAADRAEAALRKHGVTQALINTGEINSVGTKANGDEWTIGVQHPRRAEAYVSLADLAGRCLATSGDYATSFSEDHRANHMFDPKTGRSPAELCSVSVVATTALAADALSTAVFVLGMEKGLSLIKQIDGVDALLVRKDGTMQATTDFPFHA